MEAHDAPYWPAAWTEPQSTSTSTILGLRCASFRSARQAACWQINGRDKVAVVGRCSPRPRPSTDPDMAARLRRLQLQLQLQFQLRLQLEYGSFRANDIKKHIMAPLWKVVVVVGCVPAWNAIRAKSQRAQHCKLLWHSYLHRQIFSQSRPFRRTFSIM